MGCTSSAPTMANSSTAEKSIKFEDESSVVSHSNDVEEIIYRATDDVKVLPSCDTLPEPVHLIRNKSTSSFKNEKDNPEVDQAAETMIKTSSVSTLPDEDKVSKLEEVVEKVVELHMAETVNEIQHKETVSDETTKAESSDNDILKEREAENVNPAEEQNNETEEEIEEALSPSQSESSRATRWEALADIAAELPASLTIDPITGQIYALSK